MNFASTIPRPDVHLITFNRGSSSLKLGLFTLHHGRPERIGSGLLNMHQKPLCLSLSGPVGDAFLPISNPDRDEWRSVVSEMMQHLGDRMRTSKLLGFAHRVVHGGDHFIGPAVVDDSSLAVMAQWLPFAPLHQARSLQIIHALRQWRPSLRQIACFDTAFHASQAPLVRRFAIPRHFYDAGIKRYGFHGLSYRFIVNQLAQKYPALASAKVVVAHLGSGASLCAIQGGLSRDSSMGFSTLDGVPMGTRCGTIDPGVLLHWFGAQGMSVPEVSQILYEKSGLLGVSGLSSDSRELLASTKPEAREALELFALRVAGEVARLASTLGGLDGLVFTAGIGQHEPEIRSMICQHLNWLGLQLDSIANAHNDVKISQTGSSVTALVMATDEEQVMADESLPLFPKASLSALSME